MGKSEEILLLCPSRLKNISEQQVQATRKPFGRKPTAHLPIDSMMQWNPRVQGKALFHDAVGLEEARGSSLSHYTMGQGAIGWGDPTP